MRSFVSRRVATNSSSMLVAPRAFISSCFASTKLYTKSHEWVIVDDAAKTATLGLANYAIKELNDITFIDLPSVGTKITQGEDVCSIESVKAVVTFKAPVSGELTQSNSTFEDVANLAKLKDGGAEVEGENWLFRVKDISYDSSALMTAEEFDKFCQESH